MEVVQCLVEEGHADVNQACDKGRTALYAAAQAGCVGVVQWLIQEGNANFDQPSMKGATPLLASLQANVVNIAMPRFLLSVGAHVSSLDDPMFKGVAKAWIQDEVQKREVYNPINRHLLALFCSWRY
jgi:hypothetical protein